MGVFIDLKGKRFGRLTVLRLHTERTDFGELLWLCRCDCGTLVEVRGSCLRRGDTKSCGCLQREKAKNRVPRLVEMNQEEKRQRNERAASLLIGQKFGRLKVVGLDRGRDDAKLYLIVVCDCDPTRPFTVSAYNLQNGLSNSCGCIYLEKAKKRAFRLRRSFGDRARAAWAAAPNSIERNGEWWDRSAHVVKQLRATIPALRQWSKRCPWLDGKPLREIVDTGPTNRVLLYYARKDWAAIKDAQAVPDVQEFPGLVHIDEAAKLLGGHRNRILSLLWGDGVESVKKLGKYRDGQIIRSCQRAYVPKAWLDNRLSSINGDKRGQAQRHGTKRSQPANKTSKETALLYKRVAEICEENKNKKRVVQLRLVQEAVGADRVGSEDAMRLYQRRYRKNPGKFDAAIVP